MQTIPGETILDQAATPLEDARRRGDLEQEVQILRRQLLTQERLASLGALAAGIAHEIKNPLSFVNSFAELSAGLARDLAAEISRQRARLDPESLGAIEEITAAIQQNAAKIAEHGRRADHIVRAMLEHSRENGGERREVDVNALLKEYVALAYQAQRAQDPAFNVSIESRCDPALPRVRAVPQDLGRVFLNLINNACYAAFARQKQVGGQFSPRITVATRTRPEAIEIRVGDNGAGIPEAVRDRIWTPFFTTKPPEDGTGLGLSISRALVVEGHGGTISFETEDGVGTEFIVTLPRAG